MRDTSYDIFTTGLYNALHEIPVAKQERLISAQVQSGITLLIMNEARDPLWNGLLKEYGFKTFNHGQYRLAWNPEWWIPVMLTHERLSPNHWFTESGQQAFSQSAHGIFSDPVGRTLEVVSYHTAAYVQRPDGPERRRKVTFETFQRLGEIAEESVATAFLAGGDDNVDNRKGFGVDEGLWAPMMRAATGLKEINAPTPTHGPEDARGRNIDSYNIVPVADGGGIRLVERWDVEGLSDHDFFGAKWRWVRQ